MNVHYIRDNIRQRVRDRSFCWYLKVCVSYLSVIAFMSRIVDKKACPGVMYIR